MIRRFTDLIAWQRAHALVLQVYEATRYFPESETYGLSSQLRRAVISISSNIAEGFGRISFKDKARFYTMALGSAFEVENRLFIVRDIAYVNAGQFQDLHTACEEVIKVLTGLIKSTNQQHLRSTSSNLTSNAWSI